MARFKTIGKKRKPGGQRVNNSHTSPKEIELQKKRAEALDYRQQGHTFEAIGEAMGVDKSTAHNWVVQALDELIHEPAKKVLAMELERLNAYQASLATEAAKGDIPTIDASMRVMDRRARYLGLYPDQKRSASVSVEQGIGGANGHDPAKPDARVSGIRVTFVQPVGNGHDDTD